MLLKEVKKHLTDNSIAGSSIIYLSELPDSPDTAIGLYETPGMAPQFVFGTTYIAWERPRLQIISRSTSYVTARNKAEDIFQFLTMAVNQTLKPTSTATGCKYLRIEAVQSPFGLGKDENDRHLISCNYQVWKERST